MSNVIQFPHRQQAGGAIEMWCASHGIRTTVRAFFNSQVGGMFNARLACGCSMPIDQSRLTRVPIEELFHE